MAEVEVKGISNHYKSHGAFAWMQRGEVPPDGADVVESVDSMLEEVMVELKDDDGNIPKHQVYLLGKIRRFEIFCGLIEKYVFEKGPTYIDNSDEKSPKMRVHPAVGENYISYSNSAMRAMKQLMDSIGPDSNSKNLEEWMKSRVKKKR